MTDAHPISRFSVPDPMTLPEDIRQAIAKVSEKSGFVPPGRIPRLLCLSRCIDGQG